VVLDFEEQPGMPLHAQIDGEEFAATARAVIEVLPRAIRLVVPKAWLDEEARLQREGAGEVAGPEVDPG
jgi:hypothetical protein